MNDKKSSIKVTDKRIFDEAGEVKDPEALSKAKIEDKAQKPKEQKIDEKKKPAMENKTKDRGYRPLKVDFMTFVSSMHASGAMHLGIISNPITNGMEADLNLAKQDIDILEMLEEKTKGNLDENESKILTDALYDLRTRYVEISQKPN